MSQSTIIAGSLFIAFLAYITSRGELPLYMSFFGVGTGTATANTSAAASTAYTGGTGASAIAAAPGQVTQLITMPIANAVRA